MNTNIQVDFEICISLPLTVVMQMTSLGQFQTLYLFLQKDFARTKSTKSIKITKTPSQKHKSTNKRRSDFFTLRCFYAHFLFLLAYVRFYA